MNELFQRANALALLHEFTESEALRRHAYAVEAAMRAAAERAGEDADYWGAVGLLHDFDYERHPEAPDHPMKGAEILRKRGYPEPFVRAVLSHASYTGVPRDTDCARWLFAVDELCGFCMACAMVQPDRRIASVKVKSVKKKLKQKHFAAKVNRDEIREGAEGLGLEPQQVIEHVLAALVPVADRLGLGTVPTIQVT
jgi:putative nucleotidyltransferase with HDIG domain